MSARYLGLRYERLLYLAGPLSVVALLLLFVAMATDRQQERREARCYADAAYIVENNFASLRAEWSRQTDLITSQRGKDRGYENALIRALIFGVRAGSDCDDFLLREGKTDLFRSPADLVEGWRNLASAQTKKPLSLYGVEIPEEATINLLGITIKMSVMALTQILQLGLAPVLLLWLGSLYNTRQRESFFIDAADDIRGIFPHLINVFPVGVFTVLRKRSWIKFYLLKLLPAAYFFVRAGLLLIFIGPSVLAYIASLYFLNLNQNTVPFSILGTVVSIFFLGNILGELVPWLLLKKFSLRYRVSP